MLFPDIPSDFIQVNLEMDEGSSELNTLDAVQKIENALYTMNQQMESEIGYPVVKHSFINMSSRTSAFIFAELTKGEDRDVDGVTIAEAWRKQLPDLVAVKKLNINASTNDAGGDISFRFTSTDLEQLSAAAKELKQKLASYEAFMILPITSPPAAMKFASRFVPRPKRWG